VRRDKRRTSPTRTTKKKRGNAKATKDNTKGAKTRIEDGKNNPVLHLPMMRRMITMPRLRNHQGVISKRMIWKALTKVLPAAVQEC
jgi:hypothetical protein